MTYISYKNFCEIDQLIGVTLTKIERQDDDETLMFLADDGRRFYMWHQQDCCESVYLEDVAGDFDDLIGSPITRAEEVTSNENPADAPAEIVDRKWGQDSFTWTFYHIGTAKGVVTLRWYGESNGYYSESVDFACLNPQETE